MTNHNPNDELVMRQDGVGEWCPIATAPEDGTCWAGAPCGNNGSWGMEPVRRRSPNEAWVNIYTSREITFEPTHWQPLPSPPFPGAHPNE